MSLNEKRIAACAKSMVKTCNLKKGDAVVVRGGAHTQALLEEIALECYRKGAVPSILVDSDEYAKRVYKEIPASTLGITPKHYVAMVKAADMLIAIEPYDDPAIVAGFPRDKLKARQKAMLPLYDIIYDKKDGKKWLYAGWPTPKAAKSFGISYPELEKIVIGGLAVSPDTLMRTGKRLNSKFKGARWVHVWDSKGTDFKVNIDGRRSNIDDGIISAEDYDMNDRGGNLPAGELFFAPQETRGSGTLFCPITRDRLSDKIVKDVTLEFKNGVILLDRTKAARNYKDLVSSFEQCEAVDKTQYKPVRTRNVAELGIGFNPNITKAIGYILTDEKVAGTVHLAFGSNAGYGGTSESTMHWDFVTAPGVNIEVETRDGKVVKVMQKGRFL
jgi:aminopeptidase